MQRRIGNPRLLVFFNQVSSKSCPGTLAKQLGPISRSSVMINKQINRNYASDENNNQQSASFINYHEQDLKKKSKSGKYTESDLEKMPTHDLRQMLQDRGVDTHTDIDKMDLVNKAMEVL